MTEYSSEPIAKRHDTSRFDSGNRQLDEWLRQYALTAEKRRTGRTFIWHAGDNVVVAYYTLAAHLLDAPELPKSEGRGIHGRAPAALLGKLALDKSLQGQGMGGELLIDAYGRVLAGADYLSARCLAVDAIDEKAAAFYERHGFRRASGTDRFIRKLFSIADEVALGFGAG